MCDGVKDLKFLAKQLSIADENGIEIIEIEMHSGNSRFRDRWSVLRILQSEDDLARKRIEAKPNGG